MAVCLLRCPCVAARFSSPYCSISLGTEQIKTEELSSTVWLHVHEHPALQATMRLDVLVLVLIFMETEDEGAPLPSHVLFLAEDLEGCCVPNIVGDFFPRGKYC